MIAKTKRPSPYKILKKTLTEFLEKSCYSGEFPTDVPSKWERHSDLILLPVGSFQHSIWSSQGSKIWDVVANSLKCERIARKDRIRNDNYRTPNVQLLKGENGWVLHTDNKIKYTFDITVSMFSAGNITEKLRIAKFSCDDETIVDMYAGIGYFTLPFIVHARAKVVHACEWNPHAVEALSKNLILNDVKERCVIHYGDNKETCPKGIADRVNLGLIPSSEQSWETACKALKPSGGILHVHGTVTSGMCNISDSTVHQNWTNTKQEWIMWSKYICTTIKSILNEKRTPNWEVQCIEVTRVKSYAPHIDHLVADISCKSFV